MKTSLFWATFVGAAFTLALSGCADTTRQPVRTIAQKQPAQQLPMSKPTTPISVAPVAAPLPPLTTINSKVKVALLLPLSGKNAPLGQAMLNAAQQAVFDVADGNFELQPHDTATAGGAEEAAHEAIAGGVQLIIGPLFATDVPVVELIAQTNGLLMLPLSTDTSLASRGVYVMGLAPGAQVERVVSYAMAHGAHNFGAVIPTTPYGVLVGQVFRAAVAQQEGHIVDIETIDGSLQNLPTAVKALAAQKQSIDTLFLPETGSDLKSVADQLSAAGFDASHAHVLGTGLWDAPDVGKQNSLLIGGWYAAPDPATRRSFMASYAAVYGQQPPRLVTLAYDATALAAVIAKHGSRYDETSLTNPNGFAGLDGIFRLTTSGAVERALAVNEVTADGARVVDTAPTSFVGKTH